MCLCSRGSLPRAPRDAASPGRRQTSQAPGCRLAGAERGVRGAGQRGSGAASRPSILRAVENFWLRVRAICAGWDWRGGQTAARRACRSVPSWAGSCAVRRGRRGPRAELLRRPGGAVPVPHSRGILVFPPSGRAADGSRRQNLAIHPHGAPLSRPSTARTAIQVALT